MYFSGSALVGFRSSPFTGTLRPSDLIVNCCLPRIVPFESITASPCFTSSGKVELASISTAVLSAGAPLISGPTTAGTSDTVFVSDGSVSTSSSEPSGLLVSTDSPSLPVVLSVSTNSPSLPVVLSVSTDSSSLLVVLSVSAN